MKTIVFVFIESQKIQSQIAAVPNCTQSEILKQIDVNQIGGCENLDIMLIYRESGFIPKLVIDIGANKGYFGAEIYNVWNSYLNLSPKTWKKVGDIQKEAGKGMFMHCGACQDCKTHYLNTSTHYELITILSFDGNSEVIQNAGTLMDEYFPNMKKKWIWNHQAVGEESGTVYFSHRNPGTFDERNHIVDTYRGKGDGYEMVPVTTLDEILEKIVHVDLVKIDTEGFDPLVLQGAQESFKKEKISILQFEYHRDGKWLNYKLKKIVEETLQEYGFVCYFAGYELYRITKCWHSNMEFHRWSNVICIHVSYPKIIESLDQRAVAFTKTEN